MQKQVFCTKPILDIGSDAVDNFQRIPEEGELFSKMLLNKCCLPQFLGQCHPSKFGIFSDNVWRYVLKKTAHDVSIWEDLEASFVLLALW